MSKYFESVKKGAEEALAWKQGKKTGTRVKKYSVLNVAEIRRQTNMTQKEFSESFCILISTLRQWEQGKRIPQGPSQALLKIISHNADMALEALNQ